jgi:hypothetical protein
MRSKLLKRLEQLEISILPEKRESLKLVANGHGSSRNRGLGARRARLSRYESVAHASRPEGFVVQLNVLRNEVPSVSRRIFRLEEDE